MRFDIAPLDTIYRGIGRSLNPSDFYKKAKKNFDDLMTCYFAYLDLMYNGMRVNFYSIETFNELMGYYKTFKNLGLDCEIIAYDVVPIKDVFGEQIELLGIDVTHELSESLLEDPNSIHDNVKRLLNAYGLCQKLSDIEVVLKNSIHGDIDWSPCWVYKIMT